MSQPPKKPTFSEEVDEVFERDDIAATTRDLRAIPVFTDLVDEILEFTDIRPDEGKICHDDPWTGMP